MIGLGIDIGTSFVKIAIYDDVTGKSWSRTVPDREMDILTPHKDWSEQDPEVWWKEVVRGIRLVLEEAANGEAIDCIGIAYQMHGLILVDGQQDVLRNAIIWNDSRTNEISEELFQLLGEEYCQKNLLNHPGSFTLSKLLWVKQHEPDVFSQMESFLLPGDYIAMKLTGKCTTTHSGLSEGIMWDFEAESPLKDWEGLGLIGEIVPTILPNFYPDLEIDPDIASMLGLRAGVKVSYRAGDQVNNGFFMGVNQPGIAVMSGGTSGVIYTLSDQIIVEPEGRYNTFLHMDTSGALLKSQLLCINSLAISYKWVKDNLFSDIADYEALNKRNVGGKSNGVLVLPFGNTSERILGGIPTTASIHNLDFNRHSRDHILRAFFESLLFVYRYSLFILQSKGIQINGIHLSPSGVFKNDYFVENLCNLLDTPINVFEIDGAVSAAKGAILGVDPSRKLKDVEVIKTYEPSFDADLDKIYRSWLEKLEGEFGRDD